MLVSHNETIYHDTNLHAILNRPDVIVYQSMHTDQAHVSINTQNLFFFYF